MTIRENKSLKAFNSFGIDVRARQFATFSTVQELKSLLQHVNGSASAPLILGGGSNILFTKDVDRLVLKNELCGVELVKEDADFYYVKAGAGENWHGFVTFCIENNYAGIENLSLIPGNVGASPMQNIGAYGVEIKDVFYELEALHLEDKTLQVFGVSDCGFGYRESFFKGKYKDRFVILSVTYRLRKEPVYQTSYGAIEQELERMGVAQLSIGAIAQAVINIRNSKLPDPKQIGNAGSFFKNPSIPAMQFELLKKQYPAMTGYPFAPGLVKVAAGWLIEQCGWKGYRSGDAGCHAKQALVLVNYGNASGAEILNLSDRIIETVLEKFNIRLEREVNII